jgi:hypothetical protein
MVVFNDQVLHVSELTERLRMSIVWHATEAAIGHRLEVSVASEGSVVLVHFFVAMPLSPSLIFVGSLWDYILY